jgi:hypothetical protein
MSNIQYYHLNDFHSIMFDNYQYKLPETIQSIITDLTLKLGITNSIKKSDKMEKIHKIKSNPKIEENWEHIKPFKATVIIENKEGSEKIINEIRICLNKISAKNYETNQSKIIELMDSLVENSDELEKIANIIFDIASTNKFFSEIYAELYKSLIEKYEIFRTILKLFLEKFTDSMKNIYYIDQTIDYDAFCKYNKMNDARKATSVFIVNLVKKNIIEKEVLLKLINEIQTDLLLLINEENKVNEVDEITENIYLLVSESHSIMKDKEDWNEKIIHNIQTLSQCKAKECKSLSSRAIFKYMDMMDKVKM